MNDVPETEKTELLPTADRARAELKKLNDLTLDILRPAAFREQAAKTVLALYDWLDSMELRLDALDGGVKIPSLHP